MKSVSACDRFGVTDGFKTSSDGTLVDANQPHAVILWTPHGPKDWERCKGTGLNMNGFSHVPTKDGAHETVLQRQSLSLPVKSLLRLVIGLRKSLATGDKSSGFLSLTYPVTEVVIIDRNLELVNLFSLFWICILSSDIPQCHKMVPLEAVDGSPGECWAVAELSHPAFCSARGLTARAGLLGEHALDVVEGLSVQMQRVQVEMLERILCQKLLLC